MSRSRPTTAETSIPVVRLAELPGLARSLAAKVRASGFSPNVIVYIETGARLLAHELAAAMDLPLQSIRVQRGGFGAKRFFAPMLRCLPVSVRDALRRLEEATGIHRVTSRKIQARLEGLSAGSRVLLVDDAADTGRTLDAARSAIATCGVAANDIRAAVLAVTTAAARLSVDFFLFERNCRMPWSADSPERSEAEERAAGLLRP